jgi:hypothetical protein
MSLHHKTNLPVPANRTKTLASPNRRNLVYLVTAMLVLFGVATLISAGSF